MTSILPPIASADPVESSAFLASLLQQAHAHPALHHPWLEAMEDGTLPDPLAATRDYARQYHGYSAWFPRYLRAVIGRLSAEHHREMLLENLAEERGQLGAEERQRLAEVGIPAASVDGVPHPELFRRFCRAVGLSAADLAEPSSAAVAWRTRFMAFLDSATPAAAVGALGLGTESVVKPMYRRLLKGIRRLPRLERGDFVFFELHCVVDEQHEQDLLAVAAELGATAEGRADLERGMRFALDLRCRFWDRLLQKALAGQEVSS